MYGDGDGATATADDDGLDALGMLFAPDTANDPRHVYGRLRDECPIAQGGAMMGEGSTWVLSRYDDVMWALRHPEVFSSAPEAVSIGQEHTLIPLQIDPPDHAKYRRWLDP